MAAAAAIDAIEAGSRNGPSLKMRVRQRELLAAVVASVVVAVGNSLRKRIDCPREDPHRDPVCLERASHGSR